MRTLIKVVAISLVAYCVLTVVALSLVGYLCWRLGTRWNDVGFALTITWGVVRLGVLFAAGVAVGRASATQPTLRAGTAGVLLSILLIAIDIVAAYALHDGGGKPSFSVHGLAYLLPISCLQVGTAVLGGYAGSKRQRESPAR